MILAQNRSGNLVTTPSDAATCLRRPSRSACKLVEIQEFVDEKGLSVIGSTKTAAAATVATGTAVAASKAAASSSATGVVGGALGTLGGLLGGLLGAYTSWRLAKYQSQRKLIVGQSILSIVVLAVFMIPLFVFRPATNGLVLAAWILAYLAFNGIWMVWLYRRLQKLEETERASNTPSLESYDQLRTFTSRWQGRRWISRRKVFGLPIMQIAFCDPLDGSDETLVASQGTARAWIAIGQRAYGRLFALGNVAVAPIAIGTFSLGIVSFGVCSAGLLSVGVLCIAAMATGVITFGGVTSGSVAIGLFSVGQIAIAIIAAKGHLAIAASSAEGALAISPEANTDIARNQIANSSSMKVAEQSLDAMTSLATAHPALLACVFAAYACSLWILTRQRRPLE